MNSITVGCIKQTESDNERLKMEELIQEILDKYTDLNMASDSARKNLAKEITEKVHAYMNKKFMEEYESIITS